MARLARTTVRASRTWRSLPPRERERVLRALRDEQRRQVAADVKALRALAG